MSPKDWIDAFALFAKVGRDVVDSFTEKHPELIDEAHPDFPPPPPRPGEVDPEVAQAIRDGKL